MPVKYCSVMARHGHNGCLAYRILPRQIFISVNLLLIHLECLVYGNTGSGQVQSKAEPEAGK